MLRKHVGSWPNLFIPCLVPSNRMTQEICRILHKTGHDPGDLGSCKILIGKIQEASGMRLGRSIQSCGHTACSWKAFVYRFYNEGSPLSHINHSLCIREKLVRENECHEWSVFSIWTKTAMISYRNNERKWRNRIPAQDNRLLLDYFLRVNVCPPLEKRPVDAAEELLCVVELVCCCWIMSSRTWMAPFSKSWASETASAESKSLLFLPLLLATAALRHQ